MQDNGKNPEDAMVHYTVAAKDDAKQDTQKNDVYTDEDFTEIKFCEPFSTEKFEADLEQLKSLTGSNDISIIGFWRRDEVAGNFYCYHYFFIPNLKQFSLESLFIG